MSVAYEIQRLTELRDRGELSETEFQEAKARVLAGEPHRFAMPSASANQMAMLLHLSQYLGFAFPVLGFAVPILIWQLKKDDIPEVDIHGRIVANWLLSSLIYSLICVLLLFVIVGFFGFMFLAILSLLYPAVGAIKANDGRPWDYPGSIHFF
ncbi:MAG: DUF4870 domain-containing protein [Rhodopirellula sp. JB044]|uniref:DUF4870 domain-containing protein n=1 Tax=Rhodopirellula sp. JB044 TaxID=3342844 RepID=UPI00370C9CF9